ncbi:MAG: glycoside hydrolase family 57 protein [Culturomica sp.]|jgi:alpha-amylase|nr:glycoside hydrolase family 57 protein [Culturomica sp.]
MEKKSLCLYFEVHQPLRLRKYQFFDIGKKHDYYDDFANRNNIRKLASRCYLPTNSVLLNLIREYGNNFKVSFSISGSALDLFKQYAPEVIESFQELANTGCVEFLTETSAHSLASLTNETEFKAQVKEHSEQIKKLFGQTPVTFRNTELIYSDEIGDMVAKMGYTTMLTEGAKHILGWKSPNFIYTNAINSKLKLLLNNFSLSDDIAFRFSNSSWDQWPLTAEKYTQWLLESVKDSDVVNLFMNYDTFGRKNSESSGIFQFLENLPRAVFSTSALEFLTPKEVVKKHLPVAPLFVPFPISWSDEERDVTAWLGNELQEEAFEELYKLSDKVSKLKDEILSYDFRALQCSDNLYYMKTKLFAGVARKYETPYASPYEAFINYMNVLSDFIDRVEIEWEAKLSQKKEVKKAAPKSAARAKK